MNEIPLISVVIPCLNRAHFLKPTIASVLQQDYPHVECIVVDGGSTDGTLEILKSYGESIKWISEPDNGHADAINKGWKMSQGDILAWLNADDVWVIPHAVNQAVEYFQANGDVDVVYGDCGSIDVDGNVVGMTYLREWDLEYAVEYCDHCIPQPAAFIRRRILEQVGWLDPAFYQKKDHELWLRIGLVGRIQHIPVLLAYERNQQGLSFDGLTAAPACIQVTRKFYTFPEIPPSLHHKKRRAFSNANLQGALYAFVGGCHWWIIMTYTLKAIVTDPLNSLRAIKKFKTYVEQALSKSQRWHRFLPIFRRFFMPFSLGRQLKTMLTSQLPSREHLLPVRDIEWSWIASQMPYGQGEALEFGNGGSFLGLIAAQHGFTVTAIGTGTVRWSYTHPQLRFVQGNVFTLPAPIGSFDLVINDSAIEQTGLIRSYKGIREHFDKDLEVMARLRELMKPGGVMLLTIPIGQSTARVPRYRGYGAQQLRRLLQGYEIEKEVFWRRNEQNCWVLTEKEHILTSEMLGEPGNAMQPITAIGCFVLRT